MLRYSLRRWMDSVESISSSEEEEDPDADIYEALAMEPDSDSELAMYFKPSRPKVVPLPYSESESVHTFMEDTRQMVHWLVKEYPLTAFPYDRPFDHWLFDFCERSYDLVMDNQYRLVDILSAVLHYISQSPYKATLYKILTDEADANQDVCVSGYITFMVNVIRGFPGVPTFPGHELEHTRQEVYHYLNSKLDFSDPASINDQIKGLIGNLSYPADDLAIVLSMYTQSKWVVNQTSGHVEVLYEVPETA